MNWQKKGLIFRPLAQYDWIFSHAWVPVVDKINEDIYRVYFSSRNSDNLSQTGYFDMDLSNSFNISNLSSKPVISLGPLGSFDDSLAVGCSIVSYNDKKYLYYVGWMQGKRVRYYPLVGLAISNDNGKTYQKISKAPIIERTNDEPFGMASPFVLKDNNTWRMWYAGYTHWELRNGEPWPTYKIRYAESKDGVSWSIKNINCIDGENEEAIARPYVLYENNIYKMWYCYRPMKDAYRIGYAESSDGINWERLDDRVGITISKNGWDSQMIEYPCVFNHKEKKIMLYNGNSFGLDGIALAMS